MERRAQAREHALRYIARHGFEAATATELAAAAGISRRTFFRYFETREDVVAEGLEPIGAALVAPAQGRPPGEGPRERAAAALRETALDLPHGSARIREALEMTAGAPELRARLAARQVRWRRNLAAALAARGADPGGAEAVAAAAIAILDAALEAWRPGRSADASAEMAAALAAVGWAAP